MERGLLASLCLLLGLAGVSGSQTMGLRNGLAHPLPAAELITVTRSLSASNYSEGGYKNGVMEDGRGFFFLSSDIPADLLLGTLLYFNQTGIARVTRVDIQRQGSMYAVFVRVDQALSAAGDGHPHRVYVTRN